MVQTVTLAPSSRLDALPELGAAGRPSTVLHPCDFANWGDVFHHFPNAEDYLLTPGDYRAWGRCMINQANPADHRRLIRFIETAKRPWDRISTEAVTDGFQFTSGAAHWAVHGLTIRGPNLATCIVKQGAEHITFDSMFIEDVDTHGIQLEGNHCTVQNCVIRRAWAPHDVVAILIRVNGAPNVGNRVAATGSVSALRPAIAIATSVLNVNAVVLQQTGGCLSVAAALDAQTEPTNVAATPSQPAAAPGQAPPATAPKAGMSTGAKVAIVAVVAGGGAGAAIALAGGKKSTSP